MAGDIEYPPVPDREALNADGTPRYVVVPVGGTKRFRVPGSTKDNLSSALFGAQGRNAYMCDHPDYHRELENWYNSVKALGQSIISKAEEGARCFGMGQLSAAAYNRLLDEACGTTRDVKQFCPFDTYRTLRLDSEHEARTYHTCMCVLSHTVSCILGTLPYVHRCTGKRI